LPTDRDFSVLSILIVNWNTRDYLRACLASLQKNCADLEHEIIVVDNASRDGSAEMVRAEFPEVRLFALDENLGFAAGNNFAYEHARGDWIWLLNADTEVLPGAAQAMIEFLKTRPAAGAVASALIDAKTKKPQRSCRTFPTPAALWSEASGLAKCYPRSRRFGFYRMGWWRYNDARPVEQPMASSFLMRRRAIEDIYDSAAGGLFDEAFPIFFNDVDLCLRLWQSDWAIWYLPHARVVHHGGGSTRQAGAEMIEVSHRALKRFYQKHYRARMSPVVYGVTMMMMELAGRARFSWARRKDGIIKKGREVGTDNQKESR
jgi:GT2 family glycosyltransferase